MVRFKKGDIAVATAPDSVHIQSLEVLDMASDFSYLIRVISTDGTNNYNVNEHTRLNAEHMERNYTLDLEYLDRLELQQDMKEVFNGN